MMLFVAKPVADVLRQTRGVSLMELSRNLGIAYSTIWRAFAGAPHSVQTKTAHAVSDALGVTTDSLFTAIPSPKKVRRGRG